MSTKNQKSQLAIIFLTVFIYLIGFGVIIPILPLLSRNFGADALQSGLLMASFSLMQFIFAPFWGRLSDKYGRRPILVFCLLGEGLAYILFAYARSLEGLFLARSLAGFFGASISTASAYISDITTENTRSKGMALIGAAFGLGFIFGPALGGGLAYWGRHIDSTPHFDTTFTALWVSGLCFLNFLFSLKFLKESLSAENRNKQEKKNRVSLLLSKFKLKTVGSLMSVYWLMSLAMAAMEATLILYMADRFHWGLSETSLGFAYIGVMMVLTQGFLVRKMIPRWGERRVLLIGLVAFIFGMSGLVWATTIPLLGVTMSFLAIGYGLANPSTMGSISLLTPAQEQGVTMGVTQSLSSLGRILGPILGGFLYKYDQHFPFLTSTGLLIISAIVIVVIYNQIPLAGQTKTSSSKSGQKANAVFDVGFFQLDNLIKNRIPFALVNLGVNWDGFYKEAIYQKFLEAQNLPTTTEKVILDLEQRQVGFERPIVVICQDGHSTSAVAAQLLAAGYQNVYSIVGGFQAVLEDRKSFM